MRIFLLGATPDITTPVGYAESSDSADASAARLLRTGGNIGNQVIAYGLLQALSYDEVSWDYSIGPQRVDEEYDVIVIAAANFLHVGCDLEGMASFIEETKLPCVMVGVGAQSNTYDPRLALLPGTERLVRIVAERGRLIGTRGQFTSDVLGEMGILNTQITGCPSYYMSGSPFLSVNKGALNEGSRLAINCSRDVLDHAFDRERMSEIVSGLLSTAISRGADFFPQTELPEIRIADALAPSHVEAYIQEALRDFPPFSQLVPTEDTLRLWFKEKIKVFWDVPSWIGAMKGYDFVLGTRFHGNMVAIQAGIPACVICHDTRTSEMCDFLKIPSIDIRNLERIDLELLYDLVDPQSIQERYSELYPLYKQFLGSNNLNSKL